MKHSTTPSSSRARPLGAALVSLACLGLGSSCVGVAAGVAATGVVASQEFIDHADAIQLNFSADQVQEATRSVLASMSMDPIESDDTARVCKGYVQGATIYTRVETLELGHARLSVGATKWALYDSDVAQDFIRRVKKRLER